MNREELKQAIEAINKRCAETPKTDLQIKLGEALQTMTERQIKYDELQRTTKPTERNLPNN